MKRKEDIKLQAPNPSREYDISPWYGRRDERADVRSRDYQISWVDR